MFTSEKHVSEYIKSTANAYSSKGMRIAERTADDCRMYQGDQWDGGDSGVIPWVNSDGTMRTNYSLDAGPLRIVQNETTKYVIASYAATDPENIEASVYPSEGDGGVMASVAAQVKEYALAACMRSLSYTGRVRHANFSRCVMGDYGIGLRTVIRRVGMKVYEQPVESYDRVLSCFTFHPLRLLLDPWENSTNLSDHETVTYSDVWTIDQLRYFYPFHRFDEDQMSTVGSLTRNEQVANARTRGMMFQQYVYHSRTKGARVYQVYSKDATGRFGQMWVAVALGQSDDPQIINAEDPSTPFGGNGMPLAMLRGFPRPESNVSISDVGMMRGDQLNLNLAASMEARYLQKYTNPQTIVDKRFFGRNVNDSDIQDKVTNQAGGLIMGQSLPNDRSVALPTVMQYPPPPQTFDSQKAYHDAKMGEKVSRSNLSRGIGLKSHQPDAAIARLLSEGDRIANVRVSDDILAHEHLASVILGTVIKGVQENNPSTLAMLRRDGFGPEDFLVLYESDAANPGDVRVPTSSVRRQSSIEKKAALDSAIQVQAITPEDYRRGVAELDMPVSEEDGHMRTAIDKAIAGIVRGEEWQPFPLGAYTGWFLSQISRARWDRSVRTNPEAIARLGAAYMAQQQFAMQEEAAKQAAMNPQQAPAPSEQQAPQTVGDVIASLAGAA